MNWSRYKLLIVSGVVCLLLSGGALFWLMKSRSANEQLEKDIRSLESQLSRLQSEPLFPSQDSKTALENEQAKVRTLRDSITQEIASGQLEPQRMIRSRFGDFIRGFVPSLQTAAKQATKGGEQGVLLQDPSFGLTEFIEEGKLPEPSEIPELMLELDVMNHVSRKLFTGGISELVSVQVLHEEKDDEGGLNRGGLPGAFPGAMPGAMPMPGALPGAPAGADEAEEGESNWMAERDRLFDSLSVTLQFKIYEDFLWDLLSSFMADPNQFVITGVRITNDNEDLWPASITSSFDSGQQMRAPMGGGRPRPPRPPRPRGGLEEMLAMMEGSGQDDESAEESAIQVAGLSDRRQRTTGGELLSVQLDLTLYRLKPQPEPSTQPEGL